MVPVAYLPISNPTLNIKMVFGEKIPKMALFQILSLFSLLNVITNLIISLPTYPKFCWYSTGTTHIFHLGLIYTMAESRHGLATLNADKVVAWSET